MSDLTADLMVRLRAEKVVLTRRPNIYELEELLAQPDSPPVQIMPDGSITMASGNYVNPDGPEAAATIEALEAERDRLREALEPFATIAGDTCLSDHPDSYAPRPSRGRPCMADFRRARAALQSTPKDPS